MSILPETVIGQIEFCETHLPVWAAAPTTIGLTAAQVSALQTFTSDARQAYTDAQAARETSKAATTKLHNQAREMRTQAADLIRAIKAFAEMQPNPGAIYAAAQIPPPAPPTPAPPPGVPTDFQVALNPDGSVTLSWNAADSAASTGAFFSVSRKLPGQSSFVGIGGAPGTTLESRRASFTDGTIPSSAAAAGVQYIVQGFRGTRAGTPSNTITVQFGVDGGGLTVTGGEAVRMAA